MVLQHIFFNQTYILTMNKPTNPLVFKPLWCLLLIFTLIQPLSAQLPTGFVDTKMQGGYSQPMGVVFSKDGKTLFVWEKKGTLWASTWNGTAYIKQSTATLNISEEVGNWSELGFQSVALDPNFETNGLIYMYYQVDRHHLTHFGTPQYSATTNDYGSASISRVTRYKLNKVNGAYTADNASRKVLIGETKSTGVPMIDESHAGGQVIFGTDGTLLVSTGDSGTSTGTDVGSASGTYFQQALTDGIIRPAENVGTLRAQILNSHCGKILRIDPNTGNGLSSNPHYDAANPRSPKSRVWTMGLRNPYRMTLKTDTGVTTPDTGNPGTILVGDVQWFSREEVHIIEKGGLNCGWPLFEGLEITPNYYEASATVKNQDETGQPFFQSLCKQATSLAVNTDAKQRRFTHFPPALDWFHSQAITRYPDFSSGSLVAKTIGSTGAVVPGTPFFGSCATSGTYYIGTKFPTKYQKTFFFADYTVNWIKAASIRTNSNVSQMTEVKDFAPSSYGKGVVDLEYCPLDQSIFYVNITSGDIQRISYTDNTPPTPTFSPDKCYRFTARHSGKVMELAVSLYDNRIPIQQGTLGTTRRQVWRIKPVDATYYQLTNGYNGRTMDVRAASLADSAAIQQFQSNGGDNQKWKLEKNTEGYYYLIAKHSGKVATVQGSLMTDSAKLLQYTKNGGKNQQWTINEITCPANTVGSVSAQIYSADGYRQGQKNIITWLSNASNADYFAVEKLNKNGNFETLTTLNAKPVIDLADKNYYTYTDNEPNEGENTYRVALIADNTPPQYSGLISLDFKAVVDFTPFPNPTDDYVEVDLQPFQDRRVVLSVIDIWGKEVRSVTIEKALNVHRVELDGLPSGQYLLNIRATGRREVSRMFNKVK